ncbi:MAG TPA: CBS domain-containing protein [Egibacteraceae bacterium]|nr:CBS domain-containing protein [Egibacteraceae bacterium]
MRRGVYAYEYVSGDSKQIEQALLDDLRSYLGPSEDDDRPAVDGSFVTDVSAVLAGVEVTKRVRVRTGAARRRDQRLLIPIQWRAEPAAHAFPDFTGDIEVEPMGPMGRHMSQLALVGSYGPPLGLIGAAADATVLFDIAQRTAEAFVARLARALAEKAPSAKAAARTPRTARPLQVRDVMTADPIVLAPDMPVKTAALLLFHSGISGAPVVDDDGTLVGVLSERDLLAKEAVERFGLGRRAAAEQRRRTATTVDDACTKPALVTVPEARLSDAARELLDRDVSRLVVLDEGRVAGIVTRHDVLAALARDDAEIRVAAQEVLRERDEGDVRVEVQWGTVSLSGSSRLRSACLGLIEAVRQVDGVIEVDGTDLSWNEDDVVPVGPMPYL